MHGLVGADDDRAVLWAARTTLALALVREKGKGGEREGLQGGERVDWVKIVERVGWDCCEGGCCEGVVCCVTSALLPPLALAVLPLL